MSSCCRTAGTRSCDRTARLSTGGVLRRWVSATGRRCRAEELGAEQEQYNHHDHRVVVGHERDRGQLARSPVAGEEGDEHRAPDLDRSQSGEHGDGDRCVRGVESRFGDRCRGGEREREVLRVGPRQRRAQQGCACGAALSMVAIQLGVSGALPGLGRFVHCWAAISRNAIPMTILSQLRPGSSPSGSLALPTRRTTIMLTVRRPAIQPNANAGPAVRARGAPRTTTTATTGSG